MVYKSKKAAMFGLDARIALAIFAVLTVVAGTLFHSALIRAEAVANIVEMNELGKAFEQYVLDTGVYPPYEDNVSLPPYQEGGGGGSITSASSDLTAGVKATEMGLELPVVNFDIEELITNKSNLPSWKGPYLQGYSVKTLLGKQLLYNGGAAYRGIGFASKSFTQCGANDCYLWIATTFPSGKEDVIIMMANKLGVDIKNELMGGAGGLSRDAKFSIAPMESLLSGGAIMSAGKKTMDASVKQTPSATSEKMGYISIYRYGPLNAKMLGIYPDPVEYPYNP